MRTFIVSVFIALIAPVLTFAQTLADHIPADAEIYVGWNGSLSPGPGYDQSHLKAVLDASQLPQWINESLPRLLQQAIAQDRQNGPRLRQVYEALSTISQHPTAIYFGGVIAADAGGPPFPKVEILCDGGADAPKIEQQVRRLLNTNPGVRLNLRTIDTLVVLSDFAVPEKIDKPLSQDADFQSAMEKLGKDPTAAMYVNAPVLVATIDSLIAQFAPPQAQQMWPQIRDSLGIEGVKAVAATAGFDAKNWLVQAFISAPAPRHGLLAMADSAPVADELLKLIPVSATTAGAATLDLGALFTQIDQAVVQFSPDQGSAFHQALGMVNQVLGFDIQKDFLAALGAQWAYYGDPASAGDGPLGFAIVNRPRNADRLQTSLNQMESVLNNLIAEQFQNQHSTITLQFRQSNIDGTAIHFLAAPLFTPSWALKDGSLYIGLYPQVVAAALQRPADAKSIKDNPGFQATMQSLQAPAQFTSFSFIDVPKLIPGSYQTCLAISRLYFGLIDLGGMQTPPMLVPPLAKLVAEAEPAGAVGWTDDAGYHFKSIEPFPGASVLSSSQGFAVAGITGQTAIAASILLPSLNRARETANRVKCASNMRQIGQAILLYSNDMKGAYPPDLGTLVKTEDIKPEAFVCPDTGTIPPADMAPDAAADWVNKNSDYIYIGANLKQGAPATVVVCYENDKNHSDGMNVLFGDGHIEYLRLEQAHRYINDSIGQK